MKSKTKKIITPALAVAELKAKYPNDVNIIDEKVVDARQNKVEAEPKADDPKPQADKAAKEKKPSVVLERVSFLTPLIEAGTHTQAELVEVMIKQFGVTQSNAATFLTDAKNPKYCKFDKLVVVSEDGKLKFK